MRKIKISNLSKDVSVLGLGTMIFSPSKKELAFGILDNFQGNGGTLIDTAEIYGAPEQYGYSEATIGMWFESRKKRQDVVLLTKGCIPGSCMPIHPNGLEISPKCINASIEGSLKRLKTDYIDIYHLHGVAPQDYITVRDRFYPELVKLKEKGKIRFTGLTELFGTDTTHETMKVALVDDLWDVIMVGYNIINPSAVKTILPIAKEKNVGTLCMFAVRASLSDPKQLKLDVKKMLAEAQVDRELVKQDKTIDFLIDNGYAESIMEAAYRFCRYTKGIDVTLMGTGTLAHLEDNLSSISKPPLPEIALRKLESMFGRVDCVSGQ